MVIYGYSRNSKQKTGFALVIALSLMAFILLLLLSFTTLVRVETDNSANQKSSLSAKQNALLGLYVAIGELQANAGGDQMATGALSVDSNLTAAPTKQAWTGTWENLGTYDSSRNVSTYSPSLLKVLVSGDSVETSLNSDVDADWPVLVGEASVEDSNKKVKVPPVVINTPNSLRADAFAYWVGDEGIKATINIDDSLAETPSDERRLLVMPRSGTQLLPSSIDSDADPIGANFPVDSSILNRIHSIDSIDISVTNGATFRKANFHAMTTSSQGVLSDQRLGGLRQDLTWMLKNDALPSGYLYQEPVSLLTRDSVPGPAWSLLQDFYNRSIELNTTGTLAPRILERPLDNTNNHINSISPVLTQLKLFFNFSFSDPELGVDGGNLRMHLFPVVVLHNPYNATLTEADYRFAIEQHTSNLSTELLVDVETSTGPIQFGGYRWWRGQSKNS